MKRNGNKVFFHYSCTLFPGKAALKRGGKNGGIRLFRLRRFLAIKKYYYHPPFLGTE